MKYRINEKIYRNMFGIPVDISDKHIKLASHAALKVMLYFMRNGVEAIDSDTARTLGISDAELNEALIYWAQTGILSEDKKDDVSEEKPAAEKAVVRSQRPDRAEVARRVSESPDVAHVLRQAELTFGRTLKPAEMSSVVYIMDALGLKASVTLMLIQYAFAEGRPSPSFLESTAVKWVNDGINSVHDAEAEMQKADRRRGAWTVVCRTMGIDRRRPSQNEEEFAARWVNEWAFSDIMLRKAYDECVDHSGKISFPYIDKVLKSWHDAGVDAPEKVRSAQPEQKSAKSKKKAADTSDEPSFDISLYEQLFNGGKGE